MDAYLGTRYEIQGELGAGGMALVYKAKDLALGRTVALKVLREEYAQDGSFVGRFEQEARHAAGLTHPNIVTIHDVGEVDGKQFIVMEYVEGISLKDLVKQGGPLSVDRAVAIGQQICSGLAFAHEHGVVHRDVKPQNILIQSPGGDPAKVGTGTTIRARLTDFGIARAAGGSSFTRDNEVMGTVHYIAPEQAQGFETGPPADIYSAGCVLYEALTGEQPFTADTHVGIAMKHIQEPPVPPRRLNPSIPQPLEDIIMKAMAKRPEDRFSSAAEMEGALAEMARMGSAPTGVFRPIGATAGAAGVGAGAAGAGVAAGGRGPAGPIRPLPPIARDDDDSGGTNWWLIALTALTAFWLVIGALLFFSGIFSPSGDPIVGIPSPSATASASASASATTTGSPTPGPTPTQAATPSPSPTAVAQVLVPSMVGVDADRARRVVEDQQLRFRVASQEASDTIPANAIIRQDPQPGTPVDRGSEVSVVTSRGPDLTTVPTLTGLSFDDASRRATQANLTVERTAGFSSTVRQGLVAEQSPAANQRVRPGTTVRLTVSLGPQRPLMPDVIGKPEAEAKRLIEAAGLRLQDSNINRQGADQVPASVRNQFCVGCVMSSDPSSGADVVAGQDVRIAVRKE